MSLLCAISGVVPAEPAVSLKSCMLFEKSLLVKYVKEVGKDPITNESMTEGDIIVLKCGTVGEGRNVIKDWTVPELLMKLKEEYEEAAIANFNTLKHIDTLNKELSYAMYQKDAACRVIAKMLKNGDTIPEHQKKQEQEENESNYKEQITEMCKSLSSNRKQTIKNLRESSVKPEDLKLYKLQNTEVLTNNSKSNTQQKNRRTRKKSGLRVNHGNKTKSISINNHGMLAAVCNSEEACDEGLVLYDVNSKKVSNFIHFEKRDKKNQLNCCSINEDVLLAGDLLGGVYCSADFGSANFDAFEKLYDGKGAVVFSRVHPVKNLAVYCHESYHWGLLDMNTKKVVFNVEKEKSVGSFDLHPDGMLCAAGSDTVEVYDIRSGDVVLSFGDNKIVDDVQFSNNGYHLGSFDNQGVVELWDLRKTLMFKKMTVYEQNECPVYSNKFSFDESGRYLACSCNETVAVYSTAAETEPITRIDAKASDTPETLAITDVKFTPTSASSTFLVGGSSGRTALNLFY